MNRQTSTAASQDLKVLLVWLERMEDNVDLPLDEMLAECQTGLESGGPVPTAKDALVIFVQPLKNGLLRVKMQGQTIKYVFNWLYYTLNIYSILQILFRMNLATPLVDGMIVSRRCLGPFVRQTALNHANRRRLDMDSYHPPNVRRKIKVQELVQKYRSHMTEAEFYAHLFGPPSM